MIFLNLHLYINNLSENNYTHFVIFEMYFFVTINNKRDTHFTWFNYSIPNISHILNQKFTNSLKKFCNSKCCIGFSRKNNISTSNA